MQIVQEMSPPPYSDLGKKSKDVFNKGYHFGLVKLDIKTKSATGVEFSTGGTSNQESGKVNLVFTLFDYSMKCHKHYKQRNK